MSGAGREQGRPAGASRTVLHIGTMKSGTSYLQDVLDRNRDLLAEAGVAYRGRGTRAVWDVLGLREARGTDVHGAWARLATHITRLSAPTRLLSMEMLSIANAEQVRTIVASFDQVEVIITARDLARQIPSAWQNVVKHGNTKSFDAFVQALVADRPNDTSKRFWRQHDVGAIAQRWADAIGADRVHVVTVPPSGAPGHLLWERFCAALELDPAAYDAVARQTSNFSLTYSDAELLRKINNRLEDVLSTAAYNRYVRTFLANEIMRPAAAQPISGKPAATTGQDVPSLGPGAHAWAVEHAEAAVAAITVSGVHVVGDLQDLVPPLYAGGPDTGPATPPHVVYPETAVRLLVQLLRKISEVDPDLDHAVTERPATTPGRRRGAGRRASARQGARVR